MKRVAAAVCAGLSAWCSLGTLGMVDGGRVGLLPSLWLLALFVSAFVALVQLRRLTTAQTSTLFGTAILILPWLPLPMPAAALLWTGIFVAPIWIFVAIAMYLAGQRQTDASVGARPSASTHGLKSAIVATALALALYGASARWLAPILPEGDAPHYLILAQSLIQDGDIQIENNHRQGDYLAYSLLAAQPDYLRRGLNGAIYSIHAPGLAVAIAPVMWLAGYPGVVAFLGLLAACSTGLVWWLSWRGTGSATAAWFGWASCGLTTPFFFHATQVFPDGLAATCLLLGTLPTWLDIVESRPSRDSQIPHSPLVWAVAGASLAVLPWLQTRLAILAAAAAVCAGLRMRRPATFVWFATIPFVSVVAWLTFFYRIYGVVDPAAPYGPLTQTTPGNLWRGLPGILFDQQFGLLPNAPVYGCLLVGVGVAAARWRRWALEFLLLLVPYVIGVGMYEHWWGGASAPARFLTPITLVAGVGGARAWQELRTVASRFYWTLTLAVSLLISLALLGPEHGRLLINFRDGIALWVEWAQDLLNLPRGLPSLFADTPAMATTKAAIWIGVGGAGWLALRMLERRRQLFAWPSIYCVAAVPMVALTLVWSADNVHALTPARAEMRILRNVERYRIAYQMSPASVAWPKDLAARLRSRVDELRPRTGPESLLQVQRVPAGTYRVALEATGAADGQLTLRVGDSSLPFWTAPASAVQSQSAALVRLPHAARMLEIAGDQAARRSTPTITLAREPVPQFRQLDVDLAQRGARYASRETLFTDDNAYPETDAFWVAGGRLARMVIASDQPTLTLFLRNAPVDNIVTIDTDDEHQELRMTPGEERVVSFGTMRTDGAATLRIRTERGFRPSDVEPGSRDLRYLGCWVQIRQER